MCGIVGVFFNSKPVDSLSLGLMNDCLIHRGPDSAGMWTGGSAGLAMRRLKVIDLATGDQPIHNHDESAWIVFNGEIYNYKELKRKLEGQGRKFYTNSDTEVILQAYEEFGEKCVDHLIGMFAFVIFDKRKNSLFSARDRLGVKPLFYTAHEWGIAVASEVKAFFKLPEFKPKINFQAISHFLSFNYLPNHWTPLEGVYQLLPGHTLCYQEAQPTIKQYWDVPLTAPADDYEESAIKEIERLLHQSMERRLIADVPIGAFLSGGLDSSTLVWLMKEHKHGKIKTFSSTFTDPRYDEGSYAREVSQFFGTEHYEILCEPEFSKISDIAWHADNLTADQACLPLLGVSKFAKEHVTVCLSGDGGDELFVGYPTFHANQYHSYLRQIPEFLQKGASELVNSLPASSGKVGWDYKIKKFLQSAGLSAEKAHYSWRTIFTEKEKQKLFKPSVFNKIATLDGFENYEVYLKEQENIDFVRLCLYADLKVWMAGNNLMKVDAMTMAHGLEARVPFLDHELVEYISKLPTSIRFKAGKLKYLLKKITKGRLPDLIVNRPKAGFHSPIPVWMKENWREQIRKTLLDKTDSLWDETFNHDFIEQLLNEHENGRDNHAFKIWGLLILKSWLRHFAQKEMALS